LVVSCLDPWKRPGIASTSGTKLFPKAAWLPTFGGAFALGLVEVTLAVVTTILVYLALWGTRWGLEPKAIGKNIRSAFLMGVPTERRMLSAFVLCGALVGFAGAGYSLSVKLGWSYHHTYGLGWIALAIVIFGGWDPLRAALGAYLFGALGSLGSILQGIVPAVPTQIFQAAPFALMIVVLLLVSSQGLERFLALFPPPIRRRLSGALRVAPPAALGTAFEQE
jgi:simple sugar transport system permease protein